MSKPLYRVIEDCWHNIFIIKNGIRQEQYGEFSTAKKAQEKCDKLNEKAE